MCRYQVTRLTSLSLYFQNIPIVLYSYNTIGLNYGIIQPVLQKFIAILELIQLIQKFTYRYPRVSLLHAVSVKEIEQVVFA